MKNKNALTLWIAVVVATTGLADEIPFDKPGDLADADRDALPLPPRVEVAVLEDRTRGSRPDVGFLRVRRLLLENRYPDGSKSAPYAYDVVERDATDAVAIVLFAGRGEDARVCLRSSLRPPMTFRHGYALPLTEAPGGGVLWEIPAGLVEADERGEAGLALCAARETLEEVGLELSPSEFSPWQARHVMPSSCAIALPRSAFQSS